MATNKKIDIEINVDSKDAVDGIDEVNESLEGTSEAFDNVADSTGEFGGALSSLKSGFDGLKKGLKASMLGFTGLKGAIAATGIGLLLLAFASLVSYFTQTKKGAELLEQATAGLGAVFGVLTDKLSSVGELIVGIFSDPKQAIIDLGESIKQNIINRIESFSVLGKAIVKIFKGDIAEGFKELADGSVQLGLGITNITDKIIDGTNGAIEGFKELGTEISNATKSAIELEQRQQALNDRTREFGIAQAGVMDRIDRLKQLSDDQTKSEEERIAFLQEGAALESSIANERLAIAREQVAIIEQQNALSNSSVEDLQKLADAEIVLAEAKAESQKVSTELAIKESAIRQQVETERIATIQQTEDIINGMIKDESDQRIAIIETESQRKLDAIKGNGEEEIALRKAIEEQAQSEIDTIRTEQQNIEIQNQKDFLQRLNTAKLTNMVDGYQKETLLNNQKFETDRQAVLNDIVLTDEQKTLLIDELQILKDEKQLLIDEEEVNKKDGEKEKLKQEKLDEANEVIQSGKDTVALANSVNDALNVVSDLRVSKKQAETDANIKAKRKELKDGTISQAEFNKFEKKALQEQAKFVDKEGEKAFKRNKALKLAQTTIDTATAVVSALTAGPFAGPILAVAAGVTGAASLLKISKSKYSKTATSGGTPPSVKIPNLSSGSGGNDTITNPSTNNFSDITNVDSGPVGIQTTLTPTTGSETELISTNSVGVNQQPIQAFVSEMDITNTQNNISNIEQTAEIGGGN